MLREGLRDEILRFITESERGETARFEMSREDAVDVIAASRRARTHDRIRAKASELEDLKDEADEKPAVVEMMVTRDLGLARELRDRVLRRHERVRTFTRYVRADGAKLPVGVLVCRGDK